ncbi:MAG: SWIM zinc finger family protein, partial [Ilumatobacter sp.]|nr:SWIM zinc finger family protein [Ilumatobacter sp.]
MSIVIRPGHFHSEPHPAGKLATTLLSVTVAGMADPARFRRGKAYVADHAVTRLEVSSGTLRGSVQGSRAEPYEAIIATRLTARPRLGNAESLRTQLSQLVPQGGQLMVSCTCPDWDDPCKHAVATMLAFAEELTARPELLVEWRCH